jgi:hypothetical protein
VPDTDPAHGHRQRGTHICPVCQTSAHLKKILTNFPLYNLVTKAFKTVKLSKSQTPDIALFSNKIELFFGYHNHLLSAAALSPLRRDRCHYQVTRCCLPPLESQVS